MARLVIFDETVRGVDLPRHAVILGRSRRADVPIHDQLLSRKHCTIVPHEEGLRLIDLKSSNGTFLNGSRIERSDLHSDDIIEIGNTIIVLLDEDTWKRGEGLARLRNPVKAQELIHSINRRTSPGEDPAPQEVSQPLVPGDAGAATKDGRRVLPAPRRRKRPDRRQAKGPGRRLSASQAAFLRWASRELLAQPLSREILEGYVLHRAVSLIARQAEGLDELVAAVLDRVLVPEAFEGGRARLAARIREALDELRQEALAERGADPADSPAEASSGEEPSPGAEGDGPEPTPREGGQ